MPGRVPGLYEVNAALPGMVALVSVDATGTVVSHTQMTVAYYEFLKSRGQLTKAEQLLTEFSQVADGPPVLKLG